MTPITGAEQKKPLSWLTTTIVMFNAFLLALVLLAYAKFGSVAAALATVRGDRLIADTTTCSFGTVGAGEVRTLEFHFTNVSDRPITLIGAKSTCTCTVAENLPMTIPPREKRRLQVAVRGRQKSGKVSERLTLYTNDPDQSQLLVSVKGVVREVAGAGVPAGERGPEK